MVAKIISGKSLSGALNYNEKKVALGKADLIWQSGFHKDIHQLNFYDKLFRLKDLAIRNERTKTNTVHISLNFAVGEKLHAEKLNEIATTYMENIGFGNQPYLVYLHRDAGHPHVHIVSTNIMVSGERISLHNLGRTKSEVARKLVERQFELVRAEKKENQSQDVVCLAKVEYGKVDTKRAISNVVRIITNQYRFTSVAELNAVLRQFNIVADLGSKESRMFSKNGLIYWALDAKGNKVGVPIKASSIYGSPTLKNLELKFDVNYKKRMEHREQLKHSIDHVMKVRSSSIGFTQALKAKGIDVVLRTNQQGRLYGVTFIDHRAKAVFNGSDLGKAYSATALSTWFIKSQSAQKNTHSATKPLLKWENTGINNQGEISTGRSLLDELLNPDLQEGQMSLGMAQNKRKKKRKKIN
ncbi:hypothetical protein ABIB40_002946 [Pedobacter sp. UYP30]|uniref:relaxase/mobilization nuclease domain-containing protein n=1 Tax=Pedobacter sp. UYP30 TaxID=1756400 RepID=UPI00339974A0